MSSQPGLRVQLCEYAERDNVSSNYLSAAVKITIQITGFQTKCKNSRNKNQKLRKTDKDATALIIIN